MFEFNPDGSIKMPDNMAKEKADQKNKMKSQRCIRIRKDIVSTYSPKSCKMVITLSEAFKDNRFVETTYKYFKDGAEVPSKITMINPREFHVEIGTCFRRCSDCSALVTRFKEFLDGNVIEDKGTCTYKGRPNNFCFEDYFD